MSPTSYRIVTIPKFNEDSENGQQILALAHKFREFRLFALKTSPGAFASTYEAEVQRGLDQTFERLRNTKAIQFVALPLAVDRQKDEACEAHLSDLTDNEWLGFVVLLGPQEDPSGISAQKDPYPEMTSSTESKEQRSVAAETACLRFHLNGMFVHPSVRNSGIGIRLVSSALQHAIRQATIFGSHLYCTCIVDEWNESARRLYERCGFEVKGTELYKVGGEDRVALRMEMWRDSACGGQATV